jgi:hypothetical protein
VVFAVAANTGLELKARRGREKAGTDHALN